MDILQAGLFSQRLQIYHMLFELFPLFVFTFEDGLDLGLGHAQEGVKVISFYAETLACIDVAPMAKHVSYELFLVTLDLLSNLLFLLRIRLGLLLAFRGS